MKVWIHNGITGKCYEYIKPSQLNTISWKIGEPKIYKWLWFGISI